LNADQLADGLREHSTIARNGAPERLGRCLVRLGHLAEESLLAALAEQLSLELVDLSAAKIGERARKALPMEFVRDRHVLPIELRSSTLRIATAEPGDARLIEDVRLLTGLEVEEVIASRVAIAAKIEECYEVTVERLVEDFAAGVGSAGEGSSSSTMHEIEVMASEPTVVNLVNVILANAIRERASDIHLVPFDGVIELRYRIDGMLRVMAPPPKHLQAALVSRIKIMADMNIAERFLPQDGHLQIRHGGRRVDIRVGTMPSVHGESVVLRLLEKDTQLQDLEELGLDGERAAALTRIVDRSHGMFLATGPTGSGKTTTLYALIQNIYTPARKFITIEDPVEYELPGVAQIPVRPARGFTFANGLRAILRQDPDVVMVGEIRDVETAEIAIRAALTGHLVFSTLHTNDTAGAITRLLDMGIEAFLIASSLEAVLAQRLVRRICSACRTAVELSTVEAHKLRALGFDLGASPVYRGKGCESCGGTGYAGRSGLFELLRVDNTIRDLVLSRPSSAAIRAAATGMISLEDDGLRKVRVGETSVEEFFRVAADGA
jgi:type II secretory ATPase GspE/PulE/Tfp pilus assembly ATPase PilB-like protein